MIHHHRIRRFAALLVALAALLLVAACGSSDDDKDKTTGAGGTTATTETTAVSATKIVANPENAKVKVTIGSKNFTEQKVLGDIYAQALAAKGYTVKTALNLGDEQIAFRALESGQISAYPEYTGTALLSFFKVPTAQLPKSSAQAYEQVRTDMAKEGITALPPTPFTSSNEVALTAAKAKQLGVTKISDLQAKAAQLKLYGSPECRQRMDCLLGLQKVYGLRFKSFTPVDISLRHEVLQKGQADVSIVFTTDPQIKRNNEVLLQDDKGMFPPYNSTLLVKTSTLKDAGPDFAETVEAINKGLTAKVMQELNARVDLDKQSPAAVAKQYLQEAGYL